jgi:hypothetical protein
LTIALQRANDHAVRWRQMMSLPATMQAGGMKGWLDGLEQKQEIL